MGEQEGRIGSVQKWGVLRKGDMAQTMYTHVSKCKNDKTKERKKMLARMWQNRNTYILFVGI
jgi:hypothetical protein